MPDEVTMRELLQELADKPIGSPDLQAEANRVGYLPNEAKPKLSPELAETVKRTTKVWLPSGRRSTSGPAVRAQREAFYERQIDLEEAVEAAGGQRGGLRP